MRGTAGILCVISFMLASVAGSTAARAGVIAGSVKDDKTGEALVGAAISVVGAKLGTTTDLDGKFSIQNVPAGLYSLRVLYSGYAQKVVAGVAVGGSETVRMDITLEPTSTEQGDAMRIDDIYVTAERVRSTSAATLTERQRSLVSATPSAQSRSASPPTGRPVNR